MVTLNNVLKPLIDELIELNRGVKCITPNHPHGRYVVVKLVGLIDNIVSTHKAGGFMSHYAKDFCSWCELKEIERNHLKLGKPRKWSAVLSASRSWKRANYTTAQQCLAQYCGIRWSEINRLPYWDPVKNICLGVLHNWYEGTLQHNFCYQWGFDTAIIEKEKHQPGISGYKSDELMENSTQSKNEYNLTISGYLSQEVISSKNN
ncbi:hypothetical protein O181_048408 [Austropuccinia psidii MF-1]|uniref:Uncharacterized protein n=1 Tax=Austropuccinia psidii MF-1 TaxID=1389203 RepID=A0A9Q3DXZ0_9BASI|nr:hypothetical protein [Austropuccinia psidii MF-1]